jgi:hypothetical protein
MNPFKLEADVDLKNDLLVTVNCKQYDDLNIVFNIFYDNENIELNNYIIEMNVLKPDKTIYLQNSMITTNGNTASMISTNKLTQVHGNAIGEVVIIDKTSKRKKYSFDIKFIIKKSAIADGINSESSITLLDQMQQALDELRDISVNLTEAIQVNSEMKTNISTGTTLNNNLTNNITIATNLNTDLVANTSTANETNSTLVGNTTTADSVNDNLENNITTGKSVNVNLTNNIAEGNKTNDTATTINSTLEVNIAEGKQTIKDLTNVNKDYSKHINNMKIHLTEDEKEQLLLLFQNFITLQNKVDRLIGDGFLSDEESNIYVDENGNTYIT